MIFFGKPVPAFPDRARNAESPDAAGRRGI
jgi:hypothetical protein